jgi:hypothetical protein
MIVLVLVILLAIHAVALRIPAYSSIKFDRRLELRSSHAPVNPQTDFHRTVVQTLRTVLTSAIVTTALPSSSRAIGKLAELRDQSVAFQGVTFNVGNTFLMEDFFTQTFPSLSKVLRHQSTSNKNTSVIAFGADAYQSPKSFIPGVSSFYEDGGHATLIFEAPVLGDDIMALYEPGNGLQYIKIGAENFRISKALERGMVMTTTVHGLRAIYTCV